MRWANTPEQRWPGQMMGRVVGAIGFQIAIGVDLAYSSRGDFAAAVVLAKHGPTFYVRDVWRGQKTIADITDALRALRASWPGASLVSYVAGQERTVLQLLAEKGLSIGAMNATGDKFTRALRTADAWNDGRILIPPDAPWSEPLASELRSFTGNSDAHDDQVDALVSAFEYLAGSDIGMPERLAVRRTRL